MEKITHESDFWKDNEKAQSILREITSIKKSNERWEKLSKDLEEVQVLDELSLEDDTLKPEREKELEKLEG